MMRPFAGVRNTENLFLSAAALAVGAGLGGAALARADRAPREETVAIRPVQTPADGYVSSGACRACHPSQYASWHASFHRTMTQIASPETVETSFDNVTVDVLPGGPVRLDERGRELWAEFPDPDAAGRAGA